MKSDLVSATGAVMNFITVLNDELIKAGGHPSMIYFAQCEHGRPMMELLAKTIVGSKLWRVPVSLVMKEIVKNEDDPDILEWDQVWSWHIYSEIAKELTTLRFVNKSFLEEYANGIDSFVEGIPSGLRSQLPKEINCDVEEKKPKQVSWEGKTYVVTHYRSGEALYLAPADYFNFES